MLLVWLAGYYFNNTTIATVAILGVIISLSINVINCFKLSSIEDKKIQILSLHSIINQLLMSMGLVVLYFIARW